MFLQHILPLEYHNQDVTKYSHKCCDQIEKLDLKFHNVRNELDDIFKVQQRNCDIEHDYDIDQAHRLMIMACIATKTYDIRNIHWVHKEFIQYLEDYENIEKVFSEVLRTCAYLKQFMKYDYVKQLQD